MRDSIREHFELAGFRCVLAQDGREAWRLAAEHQFDLLVLDAALPYLDGVSLCRQVRREGRNQDAAILLLLGGGAESERLLGLESGADDYLTKPVSVRELVARARVLTRRVRGAFVQEVGAAAPVRLHNLEIEPARRAVIVRGTPVPVSRQEFALLYVLASHPGIVFTRERLLARLWQDRGFVTPRSVDALVKRLRRKVEIDPSQPALILTVWGDGYKFADHGL